MRRICLKGVSDICGISEKIDQIKANRDFLCNVVAFKPVGELAICCNEEITPTTDQFETKVKSLQILNAMQKLIQYSKTDFPEDFSTALSPMIPMIPT